MIQQAIHDVTGRKNLDFNTTKQVMGEVMNGEATQAQMASSLTGLRMKGESIKEIMACAAVMREKTSKLTPSFDVIDIVGTGGGEVDTFNISTASTSVVAAGGVPVAKHGNRSVSSKDGATDVLEQPGMSLALTAGQSEKLLEETGMCFMFAQAYHSSMKYAAPVRKELTIRTIFDILGPLSSPAGVTMQLLSVYDKSPVEPLTEVLNNLGITRELVICGAGGLDKTTMTGPTHVCEVRFGKLKTCDITPEEMGLSRYRLSDTIGGTPEGDAQIAKDVLSGELKGAKRNIMILNSAVSLYLGIDDCTVKDCVRRAVKLINSGTTYAKLNEFINATKTCQTLQMIRGEDMILDAIAGTAKLWVLGARKRCPSEEAKEKALALPKRKFPFEQVTNCPNMAFICEMKKTSSSKRAIAPNFPYTETARDHEMAGAPAISVLTEPGHFMGRSQYPTEIKNAVQIPLLRKDFTADEYQIYEAKVIGADAVLLICSLLDTETPSSYISVCDRLGLSALAEAHTKEEVLSAHEAGTRIIGINNRNLKTFEVDFNNSVQLCSLAPPEILFMAGGGIRTAADIHVLCEAGISTVLVGGTLMRLMNKKLELDKLRSGCYLM